MSPSVIVRLRCHVVLIYNTCLWVHSSPPSYYVLFCLPCFYSAPLPPALTFLPHATSITYHLTAAPVGHLVHATTTTIPYLLPLHMTLLYSVTVFLAFLLLYSTCMPHCHHLYPYILHVRILHVLYLFPLFILFLYIPVLASP